MAAIDLIISAGYLSQHRSKLHIEILLTSPRSTAANGQGLSFECSIYPYGQAAAERILLHEEDME